MAAVAGRCYTAATWSIEATSVVGVHSDHLSMKLPAAVKGSAPDKGGPGVPEAEAPTSSNQRQQRDLVVGHGP